MSGLTGTGLTANFDGLGHLIDITGTTPAASTISLSYNLSDGTATTTATVTLSVIDTTSGVDSFTLDGNDFSYIDALSGVDTLIGDATLIGNAGIDYFIGSAGNDALSGGDANDMLFGVGNDDVLNGGAGNDSLDGGAGIDKLNGGVGKDTLTGGAGNDTFVFDAALNATTNVDTITDFVSGTDKINLINGTGPFSAIATGSLTYAVAGATLDILGDSGANTAATSATRIIYDPSSGALYYDADGTGTGAAAIQFATLGTATHPSTLVGTDFVVGP